MTVCLGYTFISHIFITAEMFHVTIALYLNPPDIEPRVINTEIISRQALKNPYDSRTKALCLGCVDEVLPIDVCRLLVIYIPPLCRKVIQTLGGLSKGARSMPSCL